MPNPDPITLPEDITFEHALNRLESLVASLEEDESSLEDALRSYEEGVQLAQHCLDRLNTAELRVQELSLE